MPQMKRKKNFNVRNEQIIINRIKAAQLFKIFQLIIEQDDEPLEYLTIKDGKVFGKFLKSSKIYIYHYLIDFHFENGIYKVVVNTKKNIQLEWIKSV